MVQVKQYLGSGMHVCMEHNSRKGHDTAALSAASGGICILQILFSPNATDVKKGLYGESGARTVVLRGACNEWHSLTLSRHLHAAGGPAQAPALHKRRRCTAVLHCCRCLLNAECADCAIIH